MSKLLQCLLLLEEEEEEEEQEATPGWDKFGGGVICFWANISYNFIFDSLMGGIAGVEGDISDEKGGVKKV